MALTAEQMREQARILRNELRAVFEPVVESCPEVPVQVMMAALGEILIQFSMSQVGSSMTLNLLDSLKEAVQQHKDYTH